jgi:hypothetical protein
MAEEKKVVYSYIVTRNEDGSVDVVSAEGFDISNEKIYQDIEDVAKLIQIKRASDASFQGAYAAVMQLLKAQSAPEAPEQE